MSRDLLLPSPDPARLPRHPRTERKNLAGLDFDPEEGEEYNEEAEESVTKNDDEDNDDPADDPADEDDGDGGSGSKEENKPAGEKEGGEKEMAKDENGVPIEPVPRKKKRGRKPKIPRPDDIFYDDKGNELNVQNEEIVLDDEDPKGRAKIDALGFLQGDRKFRVKSFTVLGKGNRQYMVSTEPARLVGFRDSYLLFKTHQSLFKKVCTNEEKMDLIRRHLIPTSYKGRAVNLVTARSIFREFGARMIVDGKKVIDDFWEDQARERGDVEGEPAEIEEFVARGPATVPGDINQFQALVSASALIKYQTDVTWMHQVAAQTAEYNKSLNELRALIWARGVKDTYSGFNFYPTASQPTRMRIERVAQVVQGGAATLQCSVHFVNPDVRRKVTGLAEVSAHLVDEIADEDVRRAVLEQQNYERSVVQLGAV
ncbi:hypothetical protein METBISCDRAFT_14934 [Metschnikowia bicuspidata]|uniref:Uncharacterized protein n=1 Tax=Metschnikowia bicuspidata TaxID=27322 RepID=A0A4P9ZG50_9ASCO|nr:hypothetical protein METBISCDRAFT_14934 [Metschnikowia bicuspidata]